MSQIDYEAWAKEALLNVVDEEMRELLLRATTISAKLSLRALAGDDVTLPAGAVKAALQNLVVSGEIATVGEAEELFKTIMEELGNVVVKMGLKALGLG